MMSASLQADVRIPILPAEELERRQRRACSRTPHLWSVLDEVKDPEIPVVSIWELGILQDINLRHFDGAVVVTITPTYSGCPAMNVITEDISSTLAAAGYSQTEIIKRLAPAWSSSWILPVAQDALRTFGIAPPGIQGSLRNSAIVAQIACPQCASVSVQLISEFGSTACKAIYKCQDCAEPFDYLKPI